MGYFHKIDAPRLGITGMVFLSISLTVGFVMSLQQHTAFAQTLDTFNAEGHINSLATGTLLGSNDTLGSHSADLFVLGGDWN